MTEANTRPAWLDQASRMQFHLSAGLGRLVAAILIVYIEAVFFVQLPKLVAMFRSFGLESPSLPGRFILAHPLLCQGIALSLALTAVWAWAKRRGWILAVLFLLSLVQVGLVARAIVKVPFSHLSSSIHG